MILTLLIQVCLRPVIVKGQVLFMIIYHILKKTRTALTILIMIKYRILKCEKCLSELKRGCVGLLNSFFILFMFLFCGRANALPQDWPCSSFVLYEKNLLSRSDNELRNLYRGEYSDYVIEVETYWQLNSLSNDAIVALQVAVVV